MCVRACVHVFNSFARLQTTTSDKQEQWLSFSTTASSVAHAGCFVVQAQQKRRLLLNHPSLSQREYYLQHIDVSCFAYNTRRKCYCTIRYAVVILSALRKSSWDIVASPILVAVS